MRPFHEPSHPFDQARIKLRGRPAAQQQQTAGDGPRQKARDGPRQQARDGQRLQARDGQRPTARVAQQTKYKQLRGRPKKRGRLDNNAQSVSAAAAAAPTEAITKRSPRTTTVQQRSRTPPPQPQRSEISSSANDSTASSSPSASSALASDDEDESVHSLERSSPGAARGQGDAARASANEQTPNKETTAANDVAPKTQVGRGQRR